METRANFILIGVFTLAGILGALGFMIWLANVQLDRQYAHYGILFSDVSGLAASGDVRFNGISVGKVIERRIHLPDPSKVYVEIEVNAATPVRENTIAQLNSSPVTGVSYISLSNTSSEGRPLESTAGGLPIIASRSSSLQQLVDSAPDLLEEAAVLLEQFTKIAGPENQAYVSSILSNLDGASGGLEQSLTDFSDITKSIGEATGQISKFTDKLDAIGSAAQVTLSNADTALVSATDAFEAAQGAITSSTSAIDSAGAAFAQAEALMRDEVPGIVAQITETVDVLDAAIVDLSTRTGTTIDSFSQTATLLNERLAQLEGTLSGAEEAFTAVTTASDSFYTLVDGDGKLLVADARRVLASASRAIANIETVIDEDVPAMVSDIRRAVANASKAVDQVATDVTNATGKLDPLAADAQEALASATRLFERSQTTLNKLDSALASADTAMGSAEAAFDAASDAMSNDLGPVLADIRTASDRIGNAAARVADDLPAITSDINALIARADSVVKQVQDTVTASSPGIRTFTSSGLNELTSLSGEARGLVRTLRQLVRRLERDPARFLLDDRVPEYRR